MESVNLNIPEETIINIQKQVLHTQNILKKIHDLAQGEYTTQFVQGRVYFKTKNNEDIMEADCMLLGTYGYSKEREKHYWIWGENLNESLKTEIYWNGAVKQVLDDEMHNKTFILSNTDVLSYYIMIKILEAQELEVIMNIDNTDGGKIAFGIKNIVWKQE